MNHLNLSWIIDNGIEHDIGVATHYNFNGSDGKDVDELSDMIRIVSKLQEKQVTGKVEITCLGDNWEQIEESSACLHSLALSNIYFWVFTDRNSGSHLRYYKIKPETKEGQDTLIAHYQSICAVYKENLYLLQLEKDCGIKATRDRIGGTYNVDVPEKSIERFIVKKSY